MQERNEQVEEELEKLVGVLTEVVPQLTEVRVFGSYNNGNWNPKKSDVDVFVETADENYSILREKIPFIGKFYREQRRKIKKDIGQKTEDYYGKKFHITFLAAQDVKIANMLSGWKGNFIKNIIKQGRLLYSNKQIPIVN